MFGSRARGDFCANSDLDIFIDYDPDRQVPSLLGIIGIEQELSEMLGVQVRITTRHSLHPKLKHTIERDAIKLF